MKVNIGSTDGHKKLEIDIARLIETRLLIQANSGGGKSWAIRKLLEVTHGHVQHIVLDIEGEFASLREKYDYILAGKGGDIPADPRSAELLARKVLELGTSIIIDLYELKHHDRIKFVRLFLEALVNAPKDLWHDALIILDEAHTFAPEKQQSEAMGAVIDLATRGRKRGFCLIPATQRLSKLHKDVAAECNNKLIGRTGLDVDMKRASEELGFSSRAQSHELRELDPGEFFAFGPAISKEVIRTRIGQVETKHPKTGQRGKISKPAPTSRVKEVLAKLTDLPKEAEEQIRDNATLTAKVRELERELKSKDSKAIPKKDLEKAEKQIENNLKKQLASLVTKSLKSTFSEFRKSLEESHNAMVTIIGNDLNKFSPAESPLPVRSLATPSKDSTVQKFTIPMATHTRIVAVSDGGGGIEDRQFGKCEKAILQFLAMREDSFFSKSQIGAMTGYSHGSGGFNNALSNLSKSNLILKNGDRIQLNRGSHDQVKEILGSSYKAGDPHSLEEWLNKLGKCEQVIYQKLLETPDIEWMKEKLGEETDYRPSSGGFNNAISRLCTLGLAERVGGFIRLNREIQGI